MSSNQPLILNIPKIDIQDTTIELKNGELRGQPKTDDDGNIWYDCELTGYTENFPFADEVKDENLASYQITIFTEDGAFAKDADLVRYTDSLKFNFVLTENELPSWLTVE
jgi:hypothetical protein